MALLPAAVVVAAWLVLRRNDLSGGTEPVVGAVADLAALLGLTGFVVLVTLGTRLPWVERIFGLDRMFRFHRRLAPWVVGLFILHGVLRMVHFSLGRGRSWTWSYLFYFGTGGPGFLVGHLALYLVLAAALLFTINAVGAFSSSVRALTPGTALLCEGPYGAFCPDFDREKRIVMIAGDLLPVRSEPHAAGRPGRPPGGARGSAPGGQAGALLLLIASCHPPEVPVCSLAGRFSGVQPARRAFGSMWTRNALPHLPRRETGGSVIAVDVYEG